MRSASDAKLAKSDDNIDGAIFAVTPIFFFFWLDLRHDATRFRCARVWTLFVGEEKSERQEDSFFFLLQAKYYFFEIFVFVFLITTKTRSHITLFST